MVVIIGMRGEPAAAEASMTLQQPEVRCVSGPWQWLLGRGGRGGAACG